MWHGYAVTSSTLLVDPPSNETIDVLYINKTDVSQGFGYVNSTVCKNLTKFISEFCGVSHARHCCAVLHTHDHSENFSLEIFCIECHAYRTKNIRKGGQKCIYGFSRGMPFSAPRFTKVTTDDRCLFGALVPNFTHIGQYIWKVRR